MGDRTVPERINEFLVRCAGRAYCDHCIQERLGLRWRQQVQLVTATLGVTSGYRRSTAECCTCLDTKQVISFIGPTRSVGAGTTLTLPKPVGAAKTLPAKRGPSSEARAGSSPAARAARSADN